MSKSKAQGTRNETAIVNALLKAMPWSRAERIAEGGMNDRGDVTFNDGFNQRWIIEAKATQTLNVTRVLAKARSKGGEHTVLVWKRLVKNGGKRRTADGEPIVVVMAWDVYVELMRRENL